MARPRSQRDNNAHESEVAVAEILTKEQLLDALRTTGVNAVERLRALPESAFAEGRYESGWDGRGILAHIAAIEWTYARLVDLAQEAPPPSEPASDVRRTTPEESPNLPTRPPRGGIDDYNARQVEKRAALSVGELIDEFAANRARTIEAVEAMELELASKVIRSAGGITGPLANVIHAVAIDHVMSHVGDITGEPWQGQRW
jgi:hypothetical protein